MKRILILMLSFLICTSSVLLAQDRSVSGSIIDEKGEPIPGATITIKGSTGGTVSDVNGKWKLNVPQDGVLIFSFIGMTTKEIVVGAQSMLDVTLESDTKQLQEVVVTALGVSREKKALGFAQQSVDGSSLQQAKTDNLIESLSGKVAGVNVRQTTTMGGSAVINIRGNSSIVDNNPLFIIDGVPVQNTTRNTVEQRSGRRGYDYGNPVADLNPDDIESMSVLKGAAATALYGARGQNGVILVTTKKGGSQKKGIGVEVGFGMTYGTIDKSTFAEYQTEYGAGYGPFQNDGVTPFGTLFIEDIDGDGVDDFIVPTREDGSYGERLDGSFTAYQWDSFVPGEANFGKAYPYTAPSTTPADFFESQITTNTNIALSGGNDNTNFRLSYTNNTTDDILPNSNLNKNTLNFNANVKLGEKLSTDVLFQYSTYDLTGGFSSGYGDNLMGMFRQWWQVNVDVKQQEKVYKRTGLNYTWNAADYSDPLTPIYFDNPYWTRYENYNTQVRDRVISKVGIQYKFTDWLTVNGRASVDSYTEVREERRAVGSLPAEFGVSLADQPSGYARTDINAVESNYFGSLNFNKNLTDDVSLSAFAGFNLQKEKYESIFASTSGELTVPKIYSLSNSRYALPFPEERLYEKEIYGYFSNISLGYKGMVFLDGNYRIDISSALPSANRQYSYGGLSASFVFSELIDASWLDFAKLRGSYGSVGNDTRALRVNDTYERFANFGTEPVLYSIRDTKNNKNLKPEKTVEYEIGAEGAFLSNRVSVDLAYYNRETTDQLMPVEVSRATGFSSTFINVGTIQNKGVELVLSGDVVREKDFTYNLGVNFTRNRNKVLDLNDDNGNETDNYTIQSYQGNISSNATVGQPLGVLRGTGYVYHENGQRLVDEDGFYVAETNQIIGDPNPDFTMGFNSTFKYKGLALSFLIDWSQGGDVYSLDMHYGRGTGLYPETAGLNDLGNPLRDPVTNDETSGGLINPGVQADGTPNTVRADASYYFGAFYWGNDSRNPGEMTVYDASYVKLREMRLTYSLPSKLVGSWSQGVDVSLVGRNLWIIHKNVPYADPESGLGGQFSAGYLSGSYPTVRSYGFDIRFKF
ncbi:SusC/RagA family TonB-linked outer membrane protein [Reichenbachiella versicolor]|uniref:SusC/RagA family TonB-linked outer membrane protein n=1 Tax=Reichenbachiella versicolor TaxID=1821036 RepID=UPI000D6E3C5F|nr:SusC/RagA family TonB-linked outer membrane protein [Reichenbachiella versicolor]